MIDTVLGYRFNNSQLLKEALTHPSMHKKDYNTGLFYNYERLELLGDSVLSMLIIELLFKKFPHEDEGKLAKRKAALVSGEVLSTIAANNSLNKLIIMSESEENLGGRENFHILENVLEAVIGAIYLDSGIEKVREIISNLWQNFIEQVYELPVDYKSKLQEVLQQNSRRLPKYELIDASGPKHMLTFKVRLKVEGYDEVITEGKSKQQAEKKAAKSLLEQISKREKI